MSLSVRIPRRLTRVLVAGLLLVSFSGSAAIAQGTPSLESPLIDPTDGAISVVPDPGVTNVNEVPGDRITVGPDGRTLTVYFWNGADGCYGLHDVSVSVTDGVPSVTVRTGMRDEAILRLCIDSLQLYKTEVVLDTPILGGGTIGI